MKKPSIKQKLNHIYHQVPLPAWVLIAVFLITTIPYGLIFGIPKQIAFSYANETCVNQFVFGPSSLRQTDTSGYTIQVKDITSVGNVQLFGTKLCFTPVEMPKAGDTRVVAAPFGTWVAAKQYTINVPDAPVARTESFINISIPTTRPLKIALSAQDQIFDYKIVAAEKAAACEYKNSSLSCDLPSLDLNQGVSYEVALERHFNNKHIATLASGTFTTLLPLKQTGASVSEGQVIYDKPSQLTFTYDKDLLKAEVQLKKQSGDTFETIPAAITTEGSTLIIAPNSQLPRVAQYELTIQHAEATDGSAIDGPSVVRFSTSGGPKVTSVSVGSGGVAQNASITVTLDQSLANDIDLSKFARIEGVSGSVRQKSANEIVFSLQNADLCKTFSLVLSPGLKSGSNDEVSSAWKFDSRTVCGTSSVIGYSVKGRAIIAYYFGNGNQTILYTGGMHGSERSGQQTMQAWVEYLQTNAGKIPANKRVVIVPNTNPDGIVANSRNNANNVNIDRNFPASNWKKDIDTASGMLAGGGGSSPASEPETKAVLNLTRQLKPRLSISFHAQGRLVGANQVGDSMAIGNTYAGMVGYGTMYGTAEEVMGYTITGEYEDWMGEELGTPAILIELPSASGNYLNSQLNALLRTLTV